MKKTANLSELTLDELNKQKKMLKGALIGLGIVMLFAYSLLIYIIINNGNYALGAIIPGGFITLLPSVIRLNQINAEIKSRG